MWYVIHTYSGYENKVASNLQLMVDNRGIQDLIQEIYVPTEQVTEIKDDKKRVVERKVFPGYVLVKMVMTNDTWFIVRNTRGCTGFVGPDSEPVPLTEQEIKRLGVGRDNAVEVGYKVGDSVKIVSGKLVGFTGTVDEIDTESGNVWVLVDINGHETAVEIPLEEVVPLG